MAKKKAAKRERTNSVEEWMTKANTAYKTTVAATAGMERKNRTRRFSTGSLELDIASGGGWPVGKNILGVGKYSTGKTEIATRAAIAVAQYDKKTMKRLFEVEDGEPCRTLVADFENTFDTEWSKLKGFDVEKNPICLFDCGAQGVDVITDAIEENHFGLIIVDSIGTMIPTLEIEKSAEDANVGAHAKLVNGAYRRWVSAQTRVSMRGEIPATIIALNHPSVAIGILFGDNRVIPHGEGQTKYSSMIFWMNSHSYDADNKDSVGLTSTEIKGNFTKNKTYVPRQNFAYRLYLRDAGEEHPKGSIDNETPLVKRALDNGIIRKSEKKANAWACMGKVYSTQKLIKERIREDDEFRRELWDAVVKKITGYDAKEGRTV